MERGPVTSPSWRDSRGRATRVTEEGVSLVRLKADATGAGVVESVVSGFSRTGMPLDEALATARQIAEALEAADALLVCRFERLGDLFRNRQRLTERHGAARDVRGEILALDEFHDEGRDVRGLLESVDRGDVRMVQRGEHFGFALKAREAIRIVGDRCRQHLDGDRASQIAVSRAIHLAIPPAPMGLTISYGPRRVPAASVISSPPDSSSGAA